MLNLNDGFSSIQSARLIAGKEVWGLSEAKPCLNKNCFYIVVEGKTMTLNVCIDLALWSRVLRSIRAGPIFKHNVSFNLS